MIITHYIVIIIHGSLWQYCKDKPSVNNNGATVAFNAVNVTDLFNFKEK